MSWEVEQGVTEFEGLAEHEGLSCDRVHRNLAPVFWVEDRLPALEGKGKSPKKEKQKSEREAVSTRKE
eukprot:CAMPEP_0172584902 /NCGR_PEP_ID=MMETSP1068-20121228/4441_1 /TAXON_ID=35684 /ORGANISM="Pseudopedinella elastica, Strain CCMP716" /LENGTH=67 /DNA_ID=CAMNT_0013379213 /DNA_START=688 /DNA_END=891 /DNA_ORIENTATION=-